MNKKNYHEMIVKSNKQEYLGNNKIVNKINPIVSVTVKTYQHAEYLEKCLESILMQQTQFPFEIIIGEDDSIDGTKEICIEYARKYPEIIRLFLRSRKDVIHLGDQPTGIFNALANLSAACGKYVADCDGDDYWTDPLKLQKQYDYMHSNPNVTFCFHAAKYVYLNNDKEDKIKRASKCNTIFKIEDIILGGGGFFTTNSIFYKKDVMADIPHWLFKAPSFDYPLALLCANEGLVGYIDEVMCVHLVGTTGSWHQRIEDDINYKLVHLKETIKMLDNYDSYTNYHYSKVIRKQINKKVETFILDSAEVKVSEKLSIAFALNQLPFLLRYSILSRYYLKKYLPFLYSLFLKSKRLLVNCLKNQERRKY